MIILFVSVSIFLLKNEFEIVYLTANTVKYLCRLKKLEIKGFKSFADNTIIHFNEDVVGIVGSNGCGKSNIVDAIRWVLGEQKKSNLRSESNTNGHL